MATSPKPKPGKRGPMAPRVKQQPDEVEGLPRPVPDGGVNTAPKARAEIKEPCCRGDRD